MKKTCLIIILIFTILFSYSCKKKKTVSIDIEVYALKVMLNLYPENAGTIPTPPVDPDDGTGTTPINNIVEVSVSGISGIYTESNISVDKPIMVDEGLTVSVKIKALNPTDTIYVGGFRLEDVTGYNPISNDKYEFLLPMNESKTLIINVSSDSDNPLVKYKTFELRNEGRGYSRMYVHTNLDNAKEIGTENIIAEYRVNAKSFSTITLPKEQNYTLGLKAVPDARYNLENWSPMLGIPTNPDGSVDPNGVIIPHTAGKKNDENAYVDATPIIDSDVYGIEKPIKLKAVFTAFPAWDGKSRDEPVRRGKSGYIISLASELAWVSYQTSIGNNFNGYIFQLQNDIDFNGHNFGGIAVGSLYFFGVIDGNGKFITNVKFLFDNSRAIDNNGFIGNLGISGVVSNLTIAKGVLIETIGGNNVGAIVGRNYGNIINCTNYADIDAGGSSRIGNNIGGIVGYNSSNVSFVHNAGMISNAGGSVGGIIGYNTGSLSNSYNTGFVIGGYDVGGVVGLTERTVAKVYNAGIVSNSASIPIGSNIGGIAGSIGQNGAQISHSYNIGEIKGGDHAGGILGYSFGGSITIDRVYNIGVVNGTASKVGGLIGGISASTTVGTGTDGLLNIYFLKDVTYNSSLAQNGIGSIEATGTPSYATVDRDTTDFGLAPGVGQYFIPQGSLPTDIWFVRSGMDGVNGVNGVTIRPILVKVGQQQ